MNKISGPLLDRIDMHIEVSPVAFEEISSDVPAERSECIRSRVIRAREIQTKRFEGIKGIHCNAQMTSSLLRKHVKLDEGGLARLENAMTKLNMSARAYDRILKVARTIADLEGSEPVLSHHVQEAICYRNLDRQSWVL